MMVGRVSPVMVPAELASAPAVDLGARVRSDAHARVLFVKDAAVTVLILLALPYLVWRLVTRPGAILDGQGPRVP